MREKQKGENSMKTNEVKISGKRGNVIIIRFKAKDNYEAENMVMSSLVEIYEKRMEATNHMPANVNI